MAAFAAFVVLVTYVLGNVLGFGPGGVGLALILAGLVSFGSYYWGDKIVLTVSGARSANRETDFDFYTVAENLALGAGLPKPRLYVIEEQALNAFATGLDPEHAVICTTRGLLNNLERSELEGVLAHELSHIRNYDTRLMSIVAILVGMIILLSDWFTRSLWWGRRSGDREERENLGAIFFLLAVIFAFLSPLIAQLIQLAISRRREFLADSSAALLTHYPEGLAKALEKLAADPRPLATATGATAHLFIVDPLKGRNIAGKIANFFNTHPPVAEMIKALRQLEV